MPELIAYVGSYTRHGGAGIYRLRLGSADGQARGLTLAAETTDPSFLALHPTKPRLYAVNEIESFKDQPTGSISAFAIEPADGSLTLLTCVPSGGRWPAHLCVDTAGDHLLVANYLDPTVAAIAIAHDGSLCAVARIARHEGDGPNRARQEAPHPHAITLDRRNAFAFAADLGADRLFAYRFDADGKHLVASPATTVATRPGAGPRRVIFDAAGQHAYLICELTSEIVVYSYEASTGRLTEQQIISTLPEGFGGENTAAEIVLHPQGHLLFATNRGHDSVAVFAVGEDGRLSAHTRLPSGGRTPRHLAIDRSGRTVVIANQDSNTLAVYHCDAATRSFNHAAMIDAPAPVCVVFVDQSR